MSFDEDESAARPLEGLSVAAQRFSPQQMIVCVHCARRNPPTRMKCLYCGVAIPETEATKTWRRPTLKLLEEWEQGFNVVLAPGGNANADEAVLREAAALLRLEQNVFAEMLKANAPLPLARTAALDEAQLIERRLGELSFAVEVISDLDLGVESKAPKPVRRLRWTDEDVAFAAKGGDELRAVAWAEITLCVHGRLRHKRIEVEEGRGRRGGENEIVESREMFEDEEVIDVYASAPGEGWRVAAESFDFSCLGERKGLLAAQNFRTLLDELRARAVAARFCDQYGRLRPLLARVWPLTERTEAGGLRRSRPGRFHTEAATIISNEAQFTRYSCLLHHLELRHRANRE